MSASPPAAAAKNPPGQSPGALPAALTYPDVADLLARIRFQPEQGRIWLDDQRMLLLHSSALGVLRRELIESLGADRARGLLTRIGYNSGSHDAELSRKLRGSGGAANAIYGGPQLHMLEGTVRVEPVMMEVDEEKGHFHGEFLWHGSSEAEEHIRLYGIGSEPACWQQIGYASGFISRFMGRPVLFREVQCCAQGASHCRIVGKPVEEWDDASHDLAFLRADALTAGLATSAPTDLGVASPIGSAAQDLLGDTDVVGASAGFNAACHMVRRVADTQATVLFLGESGVGKEVLARSLHRVSPRGAGPFITINCAAIPETLIESELFGVERGAFTGATTARPGRFERAHGGTLFLDEIGILSWTAQGKLLRALQEREIERVGGTRTHKVDVRLVAATNLDLREEVRARRFREDLFFRLNVFPITVPPLRERREDIPIFMNHFLRKFNLRNARKVTGFTGRAIDAMLGYDWPGNIRELENIVERGMILAPEGGAIDAFHLFSGGEQLASGTLSLDRGGSLRSDQQKAAAEAAPAAQEVPPEARTSQAIADLLDAVGNGAAEGLSIDRIEALMIERAVAQAGGNLSAAARLLGITRPQLAYRLKAARRGANPETAP
ncbi:sigma-54-dependent Fis family transcriptional regulator [Nevskia ramosa]|uniref:sigma-54-dependent Fis family transcriptional regulator n=1 Tax=Nevskia ramosa TaxID=64002 RepID=UPI0023579474|nr:sigma-54-dependent Fis family transcriptional regulator [Nevskia ramosa]